MQKEKIATPNDGAPSITRRVRMSKKERLRLRRQQERRIDMFAFAVDEMCKEGGNDGNEKNRNGKR